MTLEHWANLVGLAGTGLLVWPAIKATRLFRLAERGKKIAKDIPREQTQLNAWLGQINANVKDLREEWTPLDAAQLFGGIALTGLSDLLPLLKAWAG
jgi:hypothetical protein